MTKQYMFWKKSGHSPEEKHGVLCRVVTILDADPHHVSATIYIGPGHKEPYADFWVDTGGLPPSDWTLTDETGLVKLSLLGWTLIINDWETERV